jgi:hypothetical protein
MLIPPIEHYDPEVHVDGEWVGLFEAYACGDVSTPEAAASDLNRWRCPVCLGAVIRVRLEFPSADCSGGAPGSTRSGVDRDYVRAHYGCRSIRCPWRSYIDLLAWEL